MGRAELEGMGCMNGGVRNFSECFTMEMVHSGAFSRGIFMLNVDVTAPAV